MAYNVENLSVRENGVTRREWTVKSIQDKPKKKKKEKKSKLKKGKSKKLPLPKKKFVKELDAVKTVVKGSPKEVKMATEGEEGYFKKEYNKEKSNFLGRYSL